MMNVTISSAVSIELFRKLQDIASERRMTVSALIRLALSSLLEADKSKDRKEKSECKQMPEQKTAL